MGLFSDSRGFLLGEKEYHLIEAGRDDVRKRKGPALSSENKFSIENLKIIENAISNTLIRNTSFKDSDFSNKSFFQVSLEAVEVIGADFSKSNLCDISFKNSLIKDANFKNKGAEKILFESCFFENCLFPDDLREFKFIDCRLDY